MLDLQQLETNVSSIETVEASAENLIRTLASEVQTLSNQIKNEPQVQSQLNDFANRLQARAEALSAAIVANTPAEGQA